MAAKYRPVHSRVWDDVAFRALPDELKLLWLYLLTASTPPIPGVIIGGAAAHAEQLGWTPTRFRSGLAQLAAGGLKVKFDLEARLVFLPNAIRYQPPHNENMVKGWSKFWDDVPACGLKREIWLVLRDGITFTELFPGLFSEPNGSGNGSPNPSPNGSTQEHQQEHQHEHQHEHERERSPRRPRPPKASTLPLDWDPKERHRAKAEQLGIHLGRSVKRFRSWAAETGKRLADWDLRFDRWLDEDKDRGQNGRASGRVEPSADPDAYKERLT